ncbi:MAG: CDP-alcohol phosphatidyltransferase family protein [Anaerolineales bacterium]|nr:CDP-alcohol phosphatidyltransferase family protein [Anaerolineales bacterium]MCB9172250.1 CDP-alcohol phosphatidyltransferase family protein [Ardenticatenales bacterium]
MANIISLSRLILLALAVILLYMAGPVPKIIAFVLTVIIIVMDGIDGMVARARGEVSELGAVMDIAIDRVVENVYWIVFAHIGVVPVWVALVVVSRGIITDAIRGFVLARGETAFEMMKTPWARWLVSGRPMRAFYGAIKAVVFAALALFLALREMYPAASWLEPLSALLFVLVLVTVATTVLRGVPVVLESRRYFFGEPVA